MDFIMTKFVSMILWTEMAKGQMEERAQTPGSIIRSWSWRTPLRRSLSTVVGRAFPVRAGPLPPVPPGAPLYMCTYPMMAEGASSLDA
jgi:hypothetical protein